MKHLMEQKVKFITSIVCMTISIISYILRPLVIGRGIDEIFQGVKNAVTNNTTFEVSMETMGEVFILLVVLNITDTVFNYIARKSMSEVSEILALDLREKVNLKLSKLPLKYYDNNKTGEILSRVVNDIQRISETLQEGMIQFIIAIITLIGTLIAMVYISIPLTIVFISTIFVGGILTAVFSKKSQKGFLKNQQILGELNGTIEEYYGGHSIIKLFNKQDDMQSDVVEINERLYESTQKTYFLVFFINHVIRFINNIGYVIIAVVGSVSVMSGTLSLGVIQAFFQYVLQASEPVTEASYIIGSMQGAVASLDRVYEVLEEEEEVETGKGIVLKNPKGNISFENVAFGYGETLLMKDINIDVKAGQKVAIVGPTGAGKTTFVNLLMRFYEISGGSIKIDGEDIRDMNRSDLRSLMGMVLQDTWLFSGTIKDNIAYAYNGDISKERVVEAAKMANADYFIRTLSEGYDTVLSDEASNLSAGQKQLLTIARAILADPTILILDEATSSVDTRTELQIQKAMENLMMGRTSFIIAHRLSTIRDADIILVMKEGSIVEQGNHEKLLAKNGFYAELYNSQFM